jgi:hypothetical protein
MNQQKGKSAAKQSWSPCRIVASTFGILVGLAGIIHGSFEILQGNTVPSELLSAAIGPTQRFWEYGTLHALTLIPNFLVTGTLSLSIGILVILWASAFLQTKYGAAVLMLLTLTLFLVGGVFAPIFTAILASLVTACIGKPIRWLRKLLPESIRNFLGSMWLGALVAFVSVFLISVAIAIFGWPLTTFFDADTTLSYLGNLSYLMLGLMLLSALTGLANNTRESL